MRSIGTFESMTPPPYRNRLSELVKLPRLAMLAAILLLSGCLTIEEHYTFKKDGSGTMEYVMDTSSLQDLFDSLGSMGEDGDGTIAKKKQGKESSGDNGPMAGSMEGAVAELKELPGIRKVKLKTEKDGYVERISFAFANVEALNRALSVLMPDSTSAPQEFFRWEGNTLVRTNNRYAREIGKDVSTGEDTTGVQEMLSGMKYKMSFVFANGIGGVQAAQGMGKEQPKAKELELSTDFARIMEDPGALDLRITLDK